MKIEKAIFACGCFWGVQHQLERAQGVVSSTVGYTGGKEQHPTYQEVKAHSTGHAEAVLVEYDAEQTTYKELCKLFFEIHDEVNTRLTPASEFWPAEDYHQHYYDKTGGEPYCHIRVKKF